MTSIIDLKIDAATYGLANSWFHPEKMLRPHRHNEIELNFVEAGAVTYLLGGTRSTVCSGQFALFWATIPHQVIHVESASVFHWVTIPLTTFLQWNLPDRLTRQVLCGMFVVDPTCGLNNLYEMYFRQWDRDLKENSEEHQKIVLLEVESRLRRLALTISTDTMPAPTVSEGSPPATLRDEMSNIERMACFIADHYVEPLRVAEVAATVHLHPNYAMHIFRKRLGMSITDYLTQYRVAQAQRLLISTDANASEIALEVGFGSVSRFYEAFKKICQQSPRAFRASILNL